MKQVFKICIEGDRIDKEEIMDILNSSIDGECKGVTKLSAKTNWVNHRPYKTYEDDEDPSREANATLVTFD